MLARTDCVTRGCKPFGRATLTSGLR